MPVDIATLERKIEELFQEAEAIDDLAWQVLKRRPKWKSAERVEELRKRYNRWYSQAHLLVQANLNFRLREFETLYEHPKSGRDMRSFLLSPEDYSGEPSYSKCEAFVENLANQTAILQSIPEAIRTRLLDVEFMVTASLLDDELAQAEILLRNGFIRPAGALAGVVLERHLKTLCARANPPIKFTQREATISPLAEKLWKAEIMSQADWRKAQWMADIRNICDHDKEHEPKEEEVRSLIMEVKAFIKRVVL